MAEITYVCKRTVVSTKPVQPNLYYPLSVLDRLMEPSHLRIVFYYRTTARQELGELTVKLRESLSETLTSFPIVTGRLQRNDEEKWMIKCNDAGVRVVEARASGSVEEWLQNVDREKELRLIHWEEMSHKPYYWSTFYIQLTEFEEGGMAIGLSCIHLLADPFCAAKLVEAWVDTTLSGKITVPPVFRPLPKQQISNKSPGYDPATNSIISYYHSHKTKSIPRVDSKCTTVSFAFSEPVVRSCIEMAKHKGASDGGLVPSPFEALAGLFWVCLSRARGTKHGLVDICLGSDARRTLGLEKGFFGNCMVYTEVHLDKKGRTELVEAAGAIREATAQIQEPDNVLGLIEWLSLNDTDSRGESTGGFLNFSDLLLCVNLENVEHYVTKLEDGFNPIRASYYVEPVCEKGQISILPSRRDDGVMSRVVIVTAPEGDLAKLCADDLIQHLGPTILMGGKFAKA